jgi:hypothetical protein
MEYLPKYWQQRQKLKIPTLDGCLHYAPDLIGRGFFIYLTDALAANKIFTATLR